MNYDWIDENVEEQRRQEEAFEAGFREGQRICRLLRTRYEIEVERLNEWLAAAVSRCRFAHLGVCEADCPVREYCEPEAT